MQVLSLTDIGCSEELPESQLTIEGNSAQKAQYVWDNFHVNCIADDTGLLVDALNGEPGVYSARYAGPQRNDADNVRLLLQKMENAPDRKAHFKTVITYIFEGRIYQFEGKVFGEIVAEPRGSGGFGYDPVFKPEGKNLTFAEMSSQDKNAISHRGRAMAKLAAFVKFQQAPIQ